ncbi:monovalent cation/H+ antiporter subunit A [Halothiobacillus sp. DCM-1]|uniref:monovalent cation/H+ antiporter subunit A n=1 Tax=Halothiobacillus sp. DCM-1 TaxID=3112558 RepID=UPI00324EAAA6
MMLNCLFALIALPFVAALLTAVLGLTRPSAPAWVAGGSSVIGLVLLALAATAADLPGASIVQIPWLPALGLTLALRLDGLSLLFAGLILAMGGLIVLYARYYLGAGDHAGRFFTSLLLFMGAMLGIVLSENLLLLVMFWELTSLTSFLLISFWQHRQEARAGARMALTITGMGGLALFGGVLLLGQVAGSYELSAVLAAAPRIQASPWFTPSLILILLGALSKSAQFPFHFWLPNAMAAPTPVSAYLHSATMVKAGIFLLMRLFPVFSPNEWWFALVGGAGLITFLLGAYTAQFQQDLKGLLAYSTLSHLGLITLLLGFGTPLAAVAAVFHLINHATFKASLFMVAGIVDHETGTRDLRRLGGLARFMPHTATLAVVAAAAMAGVPLLNGFISKELFFGAAVDHARALGSAWLLPVLVTIGGAWSVAYALKFVLGTFFGAPSPDLPTQPHEPPRAMRLPIDLLVALCLALGLLPTVLIGGLLSGAVAALLQAPAPAFSLALWHGWNAPLGMSAAAIVGGILFYRLRRPLQRGHDQLLGRLSAARIFWRLHHALESGAAQLTVRIDQGRLQPMLLATLLSAVFATGLGFVRFTAPLIGTAPAPATDWLTALGMIGLMGISLIVVIVHRARLIALLWVAALGLGVSLLFLRFSAPDLALTQLSVEAITMVLMLLALRHLPAQSHAEPLPRRLRDGLLALGIGGGITLLTGAIMTRQTETIAAYFLANSLSGGGGHNVVNVILVDFRGYDTFGEISVLALAALSVFALLEHLTVPKPAGHPQALRLAQAPLFQSFLPILFPLTILFAVFLLLRGHNAPGGGFIAGLVAAAALLLVYLGFGAQKSARWLPLSTQGALSLGLGLALMTGLAALLFQRPFLTSTFGHWHLPLIGEIELASAMVFDFGVFFVVLGATMMMLTRLAAIPETPTARGNS